VDAKAAASRRSSFGTPALAVTKSAKKDLCASKRSMDYRHLLFKLVSDHPSQATCDSASPLGSVKRLTNDRGQRPDTRGRPAILAFPREPTTTVRRLSNDRVFAIYPQLPLPSLRPKRAAYGVAAHFGRFTPFIMSHRQSDSSATKAGTDYFRLADDTPVGQRSRASMVVFPRKGPFR
jgi:hypothetical protein